MGELWERTQLTQVKYPRLPLSRTRSRTWTRTVLNRRPPACRAGALPTELRVRMEKTGIEPVTFGVPRQRSPD